IRKLLSGGPRGLAAFEQGEGFAVPGLASQPEHVLLDHRPRPVSLSDGVQMMNALDLLGPAGARLRHPLLVGRPRREIAAPAVFGVRFGVDERPYQAVQPPAVYPLKLLLFLQEERLAVE